MRAAAAADGIDLVAFSSFRDFDRQLAIWNGKFRGERPMQDRAGRSLDALHTLARRAGGRHPVVVGAARGQSPSLGHGLRRHGPGGAAAPVTGIQVVPAEYQAGGPFERLTTWLDGHMQAFGFFRPYGTDRGGVSPEPWHLSHAPVALAAQRALSLDRLRQVLAASAIDGREEVLETLADTFQRYVVDVDAPPEAAILSPRLS